MPTMLTTYVQNHKGANFCVKTSRSIVRNCGIRSFWHLCPLAKTYILVAQNVLNRYPTAMFPGNTKFSNDHQIVQDQRTKSSDHQNLLYIKYTQTLFTLQVVPYKLLVVTIHITDNGSPFISKEITYFLQQ